MYLTWWTLEFLPRGCDTHYICAHPECIHVTVKILRRRTLLLWSTGEQVDEDVSEAEAAL